jgi:hypothetical protein
MDAYDKCTNLEKEILPMLPFMVEAKNFSDHPRIVESGVKKSDRL